MPSCEDVARAALAAVGADAGAVLTSSWVNRRYEELAGRLHLRHLRRVGQLVVPGVYATGTATVVRGSKTVSLSATLPGQVTGRFLQVGVGWYEIVGQGPTTLTLAVPYSEANASATTFKVVAQRVELPADVRELGEFVLQRRREAPLDWISLEGLNRIAPSRQYATSTPAVVCDLGYSRDNLPLVEFWPYSTTDEALTYTYYAKPPTLAFKDPLPGIFDLFPLVEGVLVDVMRYKAAQAADAGNIEAAGYWRNEYRAQDTKWQNMLMDIRKRDRARDDQSFGLSRNGRGAGDVVTAGDEVYARGSRP